MGGSGARGISGESFFFFPGKGYSLSLGAVVIAGGGSGLNFHADALRSRRLALPACLSGALTRRGPEAAFSFVPSSLRGDGGCEPATTAVLRPRGAVPQGWDSCGGRNAAPGQGRCRGRDLPSLPLCWAPAEGPGAVARGVWWHNFHPPRERSLRGTSAEGRPLGSESQL